MPGDFDLYIDGICLTSSFLDEVLFEECRCTALYWDGLLSVDLAEYADPRLESLLWLSWRLPGLEICPPDGNWRPGCAWRPVDGGRLAGWRRDEDVEFGLLPLVVGLSAWCGDVGRP